MAYNPYAVTPEEMAYVAEYFESYAKARRASKELKAEMAKQAKLYRQYEKEARVLNGSV